MAYFRPFIAVLVNTRGFRGVNAVLPSIFSLLLTHRKCTSIEDHLGCEDFFLFLSVRLSLGLSVCPRAYLSVSIYGVDMRC